MKNISVGNWAVITAAVLWSVDGLLRRQLFHLPASVIVFWEHVIGFAILIPVLVYGWSKIGKRLPTAQQWVAIGAVALLSGALGTILFTQALFEVNFTSFSVVILLQQLQPLFAILGAAVILRERPNKKFFLVAAAAVVGAYFLNFPEGTPNLATGEGTVLAGLMAVGAAAAWGFSTALSKYSLKGISPVLTTAARFGLAPVFALIFVASEGNLATLTTLKDIDVLLLIAIALSTGMVALYIYYYGLKRIPASRSTILELAFPVSAALIGFFFFGDRLTITQWIGAVVLAYSMYIISQIKLKTAKGHS